MGAGQMPSQCASLTSVTRIFPEAGAGCGWAVSGRQSHGDSAVRPRCWPRLPSLLINSGDATAPALMGTSRAGVSCTHHTRSLWGAVQPLWSDPKGHG